jgi:hypothetical protein
MCPLPLLGGTLEEGAAGLLVDLDVAAVVGFVHRIRIRVDDCPCGVARDLRCSAVAAGAVDRGPGGRIADPLPDPPIVDVDRKRVLVLNRHRHPALARADTGLTRGRRSVA